MLTTSILCSIQRPAVIPSNLSNKDIGIFQHILEPVPKLNTSYKKSSTAPNCLAVSETHIFAAQADKAIIQVYDREKGVKEADVPFGERITSCCFIGFEDGGGLGVLALGMDGGRLILWEICTGRQVSTPPAHLEAVTCLAIDSTRNFLLSGSKDHNVHVWRLMDLLSFSTDSRTPYKTFSDHRGPITSLAVGHSQLSNDLVISASEDQTILLWNYRTATKLATFLASSIPRCLVLDPADRAFYVGCDDSVQFVNLHPIQLSVSHEAIELLDKNKWKNETGVKCLAVSSDGAQLFTGHENGKVLRRTTPKGQPSLVYDSHLPVSNIFASIPSGFPNERAAASRPVIVKPKLDMAVKNNDSLVPDRYELNAIFTSRLHDSDIEEKDLFTKFDAMLEHPSFPAELLHAPLIIPIKSKGTEVSEEVLEEFENLKRENKVATTHITALEDEIKRLREFEEARQRSKKLKRIRKSKAAEAMRKKAMGEVNGDMDVDEDEEIGVDPSSSDDD